MIGDHDHRLEAIRGPPGPLEDLRADRPLKGREPERVAAVDPEEELHEVVAQSTNPIVQNKMSHQTKSTNPPCVESQPMSDAGRIWSRAGVAFLAICAMSTVSACGPGSETDPRPTPSPGVALSARAAPAAPVAPPPASAVIVPGGRFTMGGGERLEENPPHIVVLNPFAIDPYEVTVERFSKFITAAKYRTEAEKWGWSGVFDIQKQDWKPTNGATWKEVGGPGSKPSALDDPVTHVSWNDAVAFCAYEKGRLPTEAEWEYAARGGKEGLIFPWGNELRPGGKPAANWWQGVFPTKVTKEDGFVSRAPVGRFKPNGYGLYDMIGNVWEWNADWFDAGYYGRSPVENPKGPGSGKDRVMRGGSWMCSENFCRNFRNAARSFAAPDSGLDNLGFRCAYEVPKT